ncbi:oligoendopeptidase F [Helicobacter saguini]|uniref:Oligoendopeptidase F n=1 Tax=Helicobacter saguini TaxID=1548018 RepID=A0A347VNV6_9HELI|nr:M3 family oligoendopeptidase [Helicobacter saguini]MWV61620.1 oligoendopeptidase F [Helicobacter saguini]MWV67708.1 oligoendopeptidase F [Helicobacter saguini]MWV72727.1 oligoendopeptidase F [Helicobacter saguini]TLD92010.1 oligoendopeptidase F [Helicobacter saguini]
MSKATKSVTKSKVDSKKLQEKITKSNKKDSLASKNATTKALTSKVDSKDSKIDSKDSKKEAKAIESKTIKHKKLDIKELNFDLTSLFKSNKDLESFYKGLDSKFSNFQGEYQGKLDKLDSSEFNKAMDEYENLCEDIGAIMTYVFLKFAVDSKENGAIYADYEMKCNDLYSKVIFFELEFASLDSKKMQDFINNCGKFKFFLENLRDNKKHKLSLKEEQIILSLSPVGVEAFSRLFDESLANMRFKGVESDSDGVIKKINEEEILALLHSKFRKTRKKAQKNFTKGLYKNTHLLTYILNMVRKNVAIMQKLRKYERPESFRHISNQTTQESVDSMIECVNKNMDLVHNYYRVKGEILGFPLKDFDRYAPLGFAKKDTKMSFADALNNTLESFAKFSPRFYEIALRAAQNGWVDSHPKPAKRGGAFSHGCVPRSHPYVLLNYTGNRRDAFTIAHEFGHAIHQELSKIQGTLNHDTPLTTAETASVFAEMLLFHSMKKSLGRKELLDIYAGKIEDIFSTMFRQIVMTNFERQIHAVEGEMKTEDFDRIWLEENKKMFGRSVELTKNYARWWSYIPHFIHSPFYCYAYSYGQLLVLALFGLYKSSENKEQFIATYIDFLSAGGSQSPRDLILKFGFDVNKPEFWNIGIKEVKTLLKEFEKLLNAN